MKEKKLEALPKLNLLSRAERELKGIHSTKSKVKAMIHAPEPTNNTELKAHLGLLNLYSNFLKNVASLAEPLCKLHRKQEGWVWTRQCSDAFEVTEQLLMNSRALTYYDARKPLGSQCDESAYGAGIFHIPPNAGAPSRIRFANPDGRRELRAVRKGSTSPY